MSRRVPRTLPLVAGVLAAGCVTDRSLLFPAGPAARRLAELGWPVLIGFTVTTAAMWGIIAWVAMRRTGTLDEHEPADAGGGERWIIYGGFVIPAIVFAAIFVATLETMAAFPMAHPDHGKADVRVTGHQWWWEVEYLSDDLPQRVKTANEIHIPVGRPIEIDLETADVIHSLWVPRLHGKVDLVPGLSNRIRLQADAAGVYPGMCAELCGLQHTHMRFLVVADEASQFDAWLARERMVAAAPDTPQQQRGQQLFKDRACLLCHTIRGTDAHGTVGPDLTHLATRRTLAAGSLPNDIATLHAWVVNAPSLKPGVQMPPLTEFTGDQLHDLVAYLQALD